MPVRAQCHLKTRLKRLRLIGLHGLLLEKKAMGDLVVIVPVLGRPHHIEPLLESLYSTVPDAEVVFMTSPTDYEPKKEIKRLGERLIDVRYERTGDYARKINVGYKHTKEPLMFLAATDLKFHPDWYENAISKLSDKIHVVGTNDLGNPDVLQGVHSTHTLVTRQYVNKFGTIDEPRKVLHEGYLHEWVDNEFVNTAKKREAFSMAMDSIVEHLHPLWGKGEWDENYAMTDDRVRRGVRYYRTRKKLWT